MRWTSMAAVGALLAITMSATIARADDYSRLTCDEIVQIEGGEVRKFGIRVRGVTPDVPECLTRLGGSADVVAEAEQNVLQAPRPMPAKVAPSTEPTDGDLRLSCVEVVKIQGGGQRDHDGHARAWRDARRA